MKFAPAPCAEFPNDNSLLHDGALWVCPWSRAKPRAIVRAEGVARLLSARCMREEAEGAVAVETTCPHPVTPIAPVVEPAEGSLESLPMLVVRPEKSTLSELSWPPTDDFCHTDALERPLPDAATAKPQRSELMAERGPVLRVPRPSEISPEAVMTPLPPAVATGPGVTGPGAADPMADNQLCDDPFVRELRALISDAERTDFTDLEPLELELTPAPPHTADSERNWSELLDTLSKYVLSRGAPRAAALLPQLLEGRPVALERLSEPARDALLRAKIAVCEGPGVSLAPDFSTRARDFREQFLNGRIEPSEFRLWLGEFLGAYLATPDDLDSVLAGLERLGLQRLLNAA